MKACAECTCRETLMVCIKKEYTYISLKWVCTEHLMQLLEEVNLMFPRLNYDVKIKIPPRL